MMEATTQTTEACLVCGKSECDRRCNPTVAAAWDGIEEILRRARAATQSQTNRAA